ncbi:MAG: DUF3310 domain-containing protein [Oscillospiraceae bacterium]|nr:DUF3310 domain-containing protein [Oscillospiraceae bacterium]
MASHCNFYRDETLIVDLPCKAENLKEKKVWGDILDKNDNVNHPEHYQGERECIDIMLDLFGIESVIEFCKCNIFKYRFRADKKNGEEDILKAQWYEKKLSELLSAKKEYKK